MVLLGPHARRAALPRHSAGAGDAGGVSAAAAAARRGERHVVDGGAVRWLVRRHGFVGRRAGEAALWEVIVCPEQALARARRARDTEGDGGARRRFRGAEAQTAAAADVVEPRRRRRKKVRRAPHAPSQRRAGARADGPLAQPHARGPRVAPAPPRRPLAEGQALETRRGRGAAGDAVPEPRAASAQRARVVRDFTLRRRQAYGKDLRPRRAVDPPWLRGLFRDAGLRRGRTSDLALSSF
mmetsp:Transcript_12610/g.43565  ORF Transcript_12610/g.43565 Transcript_12610/m.43565 type:complete len:240 (-) Transcript_12610:23-742(-)